MSRFVLTAQLQLQAPNNVAQVVRQIQSQLNNVNVNLNVQGSARAQRQLQQVTAQTQAATTAADRMGRAFAISIRRFAAFSIATRAVGLFTSTLGDAVKQAIDFQREMVRVSQVTGETLGNLKFLAKGVTDLSTSLGVVSSDLLQAGQLLLQAGVSAKDTEVALKTLARAALAPNFDSLSETTEGAIAILAQFGEGVGALEKQLGAINAVAGAFAVEAGDLIDVIRRAGGVFKASGGDLNELIALFTSVRATTRESAESIGTGLRTIFTRIQRPKTIEFLKQFGVELVDMEGKFVGPYEAVRRLSSALAGLGEGDITFIRIAEELGGFRQIGKVLPLLQQFSTAQNALNVAQKAGNSLAKDAETAQQALAIRILKVKEEFLALIRSMTETSTFQIMANTALSLASALIKIGEAIKPLLPLLAAVAAVNIARGIGTFAGGIMRGMQSGRTYSTGGKVHHFARGGMVPGTGNRDSVPAMLQPGEFVIKKSSVNKLGAGNLAAMNENKYAGGGNIAMKSASMALIGKRRLSVQEMLKAAKRSNYDLERLDNGKLQLSRNGKTYHTNLSDDEASELLASMATGYNRGGMATSEILSTARADKTLGPNPNKEKTKSYKSGSAKSTAVQFAVSPGSIGAFFMNPAGVSDKPVPFKDTPFVLKNEKLKSLSGITGKKLGFGDTEVSALLKSGTVSTFFPSLQDVSQGSFGDIVQRSVKQKLSEAVIDSASIIENQLGSPLNGNKSALKATASQRIQQDLGAIRTTSGYLFEGIIDALSGAKPASNQSTFDFPASSLQGNRKRLSALFGPLGKLGQADAKASFSTDIISGNKSGTLVSKIVNSINNGVLGGIKMIPQRKNLGGIIQKFAAGGGVGTDTVPALLTPGEFVVNRSSAKSIGYGNLNRMNKVGRYAKGGVVQRFATGTPMSGAKTSGGINIPGFNTQPFGLLEKAILSLVTNFSSTAQISNKVQSKWSMLDKISPALAHALDGYISALKLSHKDALELTSAYNSLVNRLVKQKVSADEGTAALTPYIHALQAATKAHKNTAATAASVPTPSPTVSPTLPRRKQGTQPIAPIQGPSPTKQNTQAVDQNTKAQKSAAKSAMDVVNNNKMFAASMTVSMIQGFLPAIDENSGALLKLSHSFFNLITTITAVGFALEAFGVKLNRQSLSGLMDFAKGKGLGVGSMKKMSRGLMDMGLSKGFSTKIVGATQAVAKFAGPVLAAAAATYAIIKASNALVSAFYDVSAQLKSSIEKGDVAKSSELAGQQYDLEAANTTRAVTGTIGAVAGGAIGAFFGGPFGMIVGAAIGAAAGTIVGTIVANISPELAEGINILFGGNTRKSAMALAAAQAGAVKTQKALENAQKTATNAMQDFENGTLTASQALAKIRSATSEVEAQEKRSSKFAQENLKNRGGLTRDILSLGGLLAESSSVRNTRLGKESAEQINKSAQFEGQRFQMESAARAASIRSGFFKGTSRENIEKEAVGSMRERRTELLRNAQQALKAGDTESADAFIAAAEQMREQIEQVDREMVNLEKEVEIAKAKFAALNLGFRSVIASADAAAMRMTNAMNSFDLATVPGVNALNTLEASLTSAGQNISQVDFDAALGEVSGILKKFGADAKQVTAFEDLTKGVATVQRDFPAIFDTLKSRLEASELRNMSPEKIGEEFKKIVGESLEKSGIGEAAKKRIIDAMGDAKISPEDMAKIMAGDMSVLEKYFGDAAEEIQKQIKDFGEKWITANQELIKATQERIEAERNLVAAQREAVDLYMEGREVQSKYGGRSLTIDERRSAVLAKSNIGAAQAGVGAMRTGSIAELRQRNAQILGGFSRIEGMKGKEGSAMGAEGAELQATQQDLQQAQKDQVQTIRDLIKLEEEELKIIQEKNRMERDSLESLISGDVDKFFAGQAASGAQAAIAAGDMRTANMFGAQAIADAFKDIQRQQEAGVQTMFGRQLGGPGGLAEQAAQASLASRGVMDPRMAQVLAGTTPEEEARRANLRDLGGVLGETGAVATAMAEMQVQTAQMKVEKAELIIANLNTGGVPVEGKAKGGLIYANRGMFVPRGTDTVPAMLTPGEFVVRREAVNRGNNLQLLKAINNNGASGAAFARGGKVGYYNSGGKVQYKAGGGILGNIGGALGIDPQLVTTLANTFTNFVTKFNDSIKNLQNTKLQIKMDSVNVNVNLNASTMLNQISQEAKTEIMRQVITKIQQEYSVGPNGKLTENKSNLPR